MGQGRRVVLDLAAPIEGSGRNITVDQFFTSFQLATQLLERNLTLVGTLNKRRREVPLQLQPNRRRPVFETVFCHSDDIMLASYVQRHNRAVIMLSTMHDTHDIVADHDAQLPQVIADYNAMKGGVDVLNKLIGEYRCRRKVNRWPVVLFQNALDISAVNGMVVWMKRNPMWNLSKRRQRHSLYLHELADNLVRPYVATRFVERPRSMRPAIQRQIQRVFPEGEAAALPRAQVNRRGCYRCQGIRRVQKVCVTCQRHICPEHSRTSCDRC